MNKEELFLEFQKTWPLEKIKNMSLEEYSSVGSKQSFTYWIEAKLESLGSIWGGSSFKFGIFERNHKDNKKKNKKTGLTYTKQYAWYSKYGKSPKKAFNNIKTNIIATIEAVQNKQLDNINNIDLGDAYKWKIAFHYQDIENPCILSVFKKVALEEYVQKNYKYFSELQHLIFNQKNINNFSKCLNISNEIMYNYRYNFSKRDRDNDGIPQKERIGILKEEENQKIERRILARKRNSKIVHKRKELDLYTCQNPRCSFSFNDKIVEVHHLVPLYTTNEVKITSINELITLCPTCHKLAHHFLREDAKLKNINENDSNLTNINNLLKRLSDCIKYTKK